MEEFGRMLSALCWLAFVSLAGVTCSQVDEQREPQEPGMLPP